MWARRVEEPVWRGFRRCREVATTRSHNETTASRTSHRERVRPILGLCGSGHGSAMIARADTANGVWNHAPRFRATCLATDANMRSLAMQSRWG